MEQDVLIAELKELTEANRRAANEMITADLSGLNAKPIPGKWSALECIEHLNRYGDFYLPEIDERLNKNTFPKSSRFKTGLLGNYFAKSMLPKEKLNKMTTFKSMNPDGIQLDKGTLKKFIAQQEEMLNLLERSRQLDLTKVKTSISISKWIKLRLGDTFRVVIYHNLRHIQQAKSALNVAAGKSRS